MLNRCTLIHKDEDRGVDEITRGHEACKKFYAYEIGALHTFN